MQANLIRGLDEESQPLTNPRASQPSAPYKGHVDMERKFINSLLLVEKNRQGAKTQKK